MKNLFLIDGTMGIGKTTVCQQLKRELSTVFFRRQTVEKSLAKLPLYKDLNTIKISLLPFVLMKVWFISFLSELLYGQLLTTDNCLIKIQFNYFGYL